MTDTRVSPSIEKGVPPSPPKPDSNFYSKLANLNLKKIGCGCLAATGVVLFLLLAILACFWGAKTFMAFENEMQQGQLAQEKLQKLQKQYDQLYKDAQLMQLRNTVYREILKKWQLNIPGDKDLTTFSIDDYFCKVWCPWYQINLPKVRQEYKESNCQSCVSKPAARPQPRPQPQPSRPRPARPVRIVNPPPAPPPPPPPQRPIQQPPAPVYIPGPTATCP